MRVLVTGGAGFIGSHLVETLLERGHEVTVLDNLVTGKKRNLEDVLDRIDFVQGDILDDENIRDALEGAEAVAHLAGLIGAEKTLEESVKKQNLFRLANAVGTLKLLQHSSTMGVRNFVFTSSGIVYGEPFRLPIAESDPVQPTSAYSESKLEAENYCENFINNARLHVTVFRLFNTYGPRQVPCPYSDIMMHFAENAIWGKFRIPGDGGQTRDFVYVKDAADILSAALEKGIVGLYNLGSGRAVTFKQLAETMAAVTGRSNPKFENKDSPKGEIRNSMADITKMVTAFGIKPATPLEEGLKATLKRR